MKISEIRQIPENELPERIEAEVAKYHQLVLNHSISPIANNAQFKNMRRTIAQMKTVLRVRELQLNK